MTDDDNFLTARADGHDETRDWVAHGSLLDATVLVLGDDAASEVLLAWRTDGTLNVYPLPAHAATVLAGGLRQLAEDARDAHLDPAWQRSPDAEQDHDRYLAHTRTVPFLAASGRLDWLAARLP